MTKITNYDAGNLAWYQALLADWQVKLFGSKPKAEHFTMVHNWGYRPGLEALHIAMCLRPEGCTVRQFQMAGSCGPANNKRRDVVRVRQLATEAKVGTPYAFVLKPTAKGLLTAKQGEARAIATLSEAPKGKAKPKVDGKVVAKANGNKKAAKPTNGQRKAKGAPNGKPAPTQQPVTENAPVTTPMAPEANPAATQGDGSNPAS